jgi:hypothetical protein
LNWAGVERGGGDPLRDGFVTATDSPILFSVKLIFYTMPAEVVHFQ